MHGSGKGGGAVAEPQSADGGHEVVNGVDAEPVECRRAQAETFLVGTLRSRSGSAARSANSGRWTSATAT